MASKNLKFITLVDSGSPLLSQSFHHKLLINENNHRNWQNSLITVTKPLSYRHRVTQFVANNSYKKSDNIFDIKFMLSLQLPLPPPPPSLNSFQKATSVKVSSDDASITWKDIEY